MVDCTTYQVPTDPDTGGAAPNTEYASTIEKEVTRVSQKLK